MTMFFASSAMVLAFRAGCQARGCARCVCRPRAVRSLKFCSRSGEWPEQRCVPARLGGCNTALLARAATIAARGGHKCKQNGFSSDDLRAQETRVVPSPLYSCRQDVRNSSSHHHPPCATGPETGLWTWPRPPASALTRVTLRPWVAPRAKDARRTKSPSSRASGYQTFALEDGAAPLRRLRAAGQDKQADVPAL